jgi:hypothetical protein
MRDAATLLGATKSATTLMVWFIPSKDRTDRSIDQDFWTNEALAFLGKWFGGATAFPRGKGVWRDDAQSGKLLFDEPVVIQCYTNETAIETHTDELTAFLSRMGTETRQGAVGFVIDRDYLELSFPIETPE